jgi:hypothetical protein
MGAFNANSMVGDLGDLLAGGVGMDRRRIAAKHPVGIRVQRGEASAATPSVDTVNRMRPRSTVDSCVKTLHSRT